MNFTEVNPLQMFSAVDVAKLLRLSAKKITDLARRGELTGTQITGKNYWRFTIEDVRAYQQRSRRETQLAHA